MFTSHVHGLSARSRAVKYAQPCRHVVSDGVLSHRLCSVCFPLADHHASMKVAGLVKFLHPGLPQWRARVHEDNFSQAKQTNQTTKHTNTHTHHIPERYKGSHLPFVCLGAALCSSPLDEQPDAGDGALSHLADALSGWHYLSNATSLIRPHSFYALFVVPRIITICYIIRHV